MRRTRTWTGLDQTIVDHRLFGPRCWTNSADHQDHRGPSSLRTSDLDQLGGPSWIIVCSLEFFLGRDRYLNSRYAAHKTMTFAENKGHAGERRKIF